MHSFVHWPRRRGRVAALLVFAALASAPARADVTASLSQIDITFEAATTSYWALGGGVGVVGITVPDFKLDPYARVGMAFDNPTSAWIDKLVISPAPPPLPMTATGVKLPLAANKLWQVPSGWYEANAIASIETTPLIKNVSPPGVPLPTVFPALYGVSSELRADVSVRPRDADPTLLRPYDVEARATVYDPFHFFDVAQGEVLSLGARLNAGDRFTLSGNSMAMHNVFTVTSTLPGLETLFAFSLQGSSTGLAGELGTDYDVDVIAHPLLGLDRDTVRQAVLDAIAWDETESTFLFTRDVTLFARDLVVPAGVTAFDLAADLEARLGPGLASTSGPGTVPEPGTWALVLVGLASMLRCPASWPGGLPARRQRAAGADAASNGATSRRSKSAGAVYCSTSRPWASSATARPSAG